MKTHSKKIALLFTVLLALLATLYLDKSNTTLVNEGLTPIHPRAQFLSNYQKKVAEQKILRKETYEERKVRIDAYSELLKEATKEFPKNILTVVDNETAPEKKLIKTENGAEIIEVTFADGSKSYYPNNESFDPSDGTIHPKEF